MPTCLDFFVHSLIDETLHVQVITAGSDENPKGTHSKSDFCAYQRCPVLLRTNLELSGPQRKFQRHCFYYKSMKQY